MPHAFKAQDGMRVPLVWQHGHTDPSNVLGHAILENREDGVYCHAYFNETQQAQNTKLLVKHGDIVSLSIYANRLVEKSKQVVHGVIREVSLVLSGANPGALIDNVNIAHGDGSIEALEDEAVITSGLELVLEHADAASSDEGETVQDIYDSMSDKQKDVLHYMIGAALEQAGVEHSDDSDEVESTDEAESDDSTEETDSTESDDESANNSDNSSDEDDLGHTEGNDEMTRNVFEQGSDTKPKHTLSHSDIQSIVQEAQRSGSLKHAVEEYALKHGIDDIDILFPDAQAINNTPEWNKRRTEWVAGVLSGTRKSPFSRIKTLSADITFDEARAKGYVKGSLKKEEFFAVSKRTTSPCTVYKKQKLDRDDIIDITDFDVVSWMKGEMRLMLEEELARAILIGDGRASDDEDKIADGSVSGVGIRPIATEDELYATTMYVEADITASGLVDAILKNRVHYKGTGTPTLYTTEAVITKLLLARDTVGRRLYRNVSELADELRVASIVAVEVMEDEPDLVGVMVNLQDYVVGADKGGEVGMFDDFDIDYNQYKYLIETRLSGALVKIKAALVIRQVSASATLVVPTEPSFVASTGVITIPTVTGVTYKRADTDATVSAGAMSALAAGASLGIYAVPASASYYFENDVNDEWTFTRDA
jgi:hypothetical protein